MNVVRKRSELLPSAARYRRVIPAGEYWIDVVEAGEVLRIVDVEGNQAADTCCSVPRDPYERYSAVDTIREQRNVYLGVGSKLCRPTAMLMAEIVADTVGRHDTLGGACAAESNTRALRAREANHALVPRQLPARGRGARELGVGKRDLTHNINFFMNVPVTPAGGLDFRGRHRAVPGSTSRCARRSTSSCSFPIVRS